LSDTRATPERLNAFCDAVFAVLITVLVLDLRPPDVPTFRALLLRWPTWLSYTVSYAFIANVWLNHHYYRPPGWRQRTAQPVAFYAAVFSLVNLTCIFLIRELIDRATDRRVSAAMRRSMHVRSFTVAAAWSRISGLTPPTWRRSSNQETDSGGPRPWNSRQHLIRRS
jgi:hypothetical protein